MQPHSTPAANAAPRIQGFIVTSVESVSRTTPAILPAWAGPRSAAPTPAAIFAPAGRPRRGRHRAAPALGGPRSTRDREFPSPSLGRVLDWSEARSRDGEASHRG